MSIYCAGCGQKLPEAVTSPTGAGLEPRSYTPRHLAEKILRDRSSLEGERRNVTVLFADAMGFTPLSERLDEEEVYQLMQGCLGCMMQAVHRYEGTVLQFTGDGVMAIFGAPIAHEDSARRAVAAALEMQRALDDYAAEVQRRHNVQCRFRVGLNTGPVVVGKISDDLGMDFTAIGDTVNLAQRMESAAEPGAVYLAENTHRAAGDFFECEPLGTLTVKGKSAPVIAYRALRESTVRTRLEAAVERGLTPFVGRAQELTVLRGYFEQARRGQGQVVFLTGEAGLGKSRLLFEFRRTLIDEPVRWLEGNCISYGKNTPYLPVIDIVKRSFGVEEGDAEARIISRLDEGAAAWSEASRATLPYLKHLLSVDPGDPAITTMDPRERQAGIMDGLRALLLEEGSQRPVLLVIEDLHWVDEKSEEALRGIVDLAATAPVLILITYRSGYVHSLGERTYHSRIALSVLGPEESATVAERVLDSDVLPAGLRSLIAGKGEGNPFYIEEVTKSLLESGALRREGGVLLLATPAEQIKVPETIQEVILSRIDRLEREPRDAIQLASVIGREFTARILDRISDVKAELHDLLAGLKSLELIYEKAYHPELSYMFKHALTHDVAYSTLLVERRRALHRLVGLAIEELYADRLAEHYEAMAFHNYEGQDWEKTLEYAEKAGDKAAATYANQDALDYYARAIEIAERIGGSEALRTAAALAEKRGLVNFGIGDPDAAVEDYTQMRRCAEAIGDRRLEGMALGWMGAMNLYGSDPEQGEQHLREALQVAAEGYQDLRAQVSGWLGCALVCYGRLDEADPILNEAEESVPELGDPLTQGFWALIRGMMHNWEGQYDRSLDHLGRWRTALDATVFNQVGRQWNEALALSGMGEYEEALKRLHEALATCERTGEMLIRARAQNTVGWILGELQDHETAIDWDKRSEDTALQINAADPEIECNARLNLADSLAALGRFDEAESYYRMVEQVVRNPGTLREQFALWLYSQHFFHSYGELWLARGDHAQALGLADECIKLAERTNRPKNVVKGRRLRGQVLTAQGMLDEAGPEIETALAIAQEIGNPPQIWKTQVALGELRRAQGRDVEAKQSFHEAMLVIDGVAEKLEDASLKQTFLSSPHVESIRETAGAAE